MAETVTYDTNQAGDEYAMFKAVCGIDECASLDLRLISSPRRNDVLLLDIFPASVNLTAETVTELRDHLTRWLEKRRLIP